jgi:hypothetical protein
MKRKTNRNINLIEVLLKILYYVEVHLKIHHFEKVLLNVHRHDIVLYSQFFQLYYYSFQLLIRILLEENPQVNHLYNKHDIGHMRFSIFGLEYHVDL